MGQEFLTARELEALGLHRAQTWRRLRWSGGGPRFVKLGRTVVYRRVEVEAWLAAREAGTTAEFAARTCAGAA
jgi:predicted DNA-binding transcriptional regulator AlpA